MTPLAYFLTWSCHGTWLHGDFRGSVDDAHNEYGRPFLAPNERRERHARLAMAGAPVRLSESERSIVGMAIRDHASHRGRQIHALNVRMTHVHVVVACDLKPELAMGQFKSWATRRLREAKVRPDTRIWTREGSTRYLFDHTGLARAIDYVLNQQ